MCIYLKVIHFPLERWIFSNHFNFLLSIGGEPNAVVQLWVVEEAGKRMKNGFGEVAC